MPRCFLLLYVEDFHYFFFSTIARHPSFFLFFSLRILNSPLSESALPRLQQSVYLSPFNRFVYLLPLWQRAFLVLSRCHCCEHSRLFSSSGAASVHLRDENSDRRREGREIWFTTWKYDLAFYDRRINFCFDGYFFNVDA